MPLDYLYSCEWQAIKDWTLLVTMVIANVIEIIYTIPLNILAYWEGDVRAEPDRALSPMRTVSHGTCNVFKWCEAHCSFCK